MTHSTQSYQSVSALFSQDEFFQELVFDFCEWNNIELSLEEYIDAECRTKAGEDKLMRRLKLFFISQVLEIDQYIKTNYEYLKSLLLERIAHYHDGQNVPDYNLYLSDLDFIHHEFLLLQKHGHRCNLVMFTPFQIELAVKYFHRFYSTTITRERKQKLIHQKNG